MLRLGVGRRLGIKVDVVSRINYDRNERRNVEKAENKLWIHEIVEVMFESYSEYHLYGFSFIFT